MLNPSYRTLFLRCWAVPVFLLVIASIHMVRVHAQNQSSWGAGCGFGMFAKVDYHDTRFYRCQIKTTADRTLNAHFRPDLKRQDLQARVVPSNFNLSVLANHLSELPWYEVSIFSDRDSSTPLEVIACTDPKAEHYVRSRYPDQKITTAAGNPVDITTLNLELHGIKFELNEKAIHSYPISKIILQRKQPLGFDDVASY